MDKAIITAQDTIELLKEVVINLGEGYRYVDHYETCEYFVDNKPACIVGHLLDGLGFADHSIGGCIAVVADGLFMYDEFPYTFSREAVLILSAAQGAQDKGADFGAAVAAAYAVYSALLSMRPEMA